MDDFVAPLISEGGEIMSDAITMVMDGMTTVFTTITGNTTLCALALGLPFVGGCISLARRLTRFKT